MPGSPPPSASDSGIVSRTPSLWLTATEAAKHARVGVKTIYGAVRSGGLRAARIGGRRELRFLATWVDGWLENTAAPVDVNREPSRVSR